MKAIVQESYGSPDGLTLPRSRRIHVFAGAGQEARPLMLRLLEALLRSSIGRQRVGTFMARGKLTPVIDRTYPLSETPDALRCVGTRGVRGKVVIRVA